MKKTKLKDLMDEKKVRQAISYQLTELTYKSDIGVIALADFVDELKEAVKFGEKYLKILSDN